MPFDQTAPDDLRHGQVWAAPDGRPMIYVRTEKRPGDTTPAHLFLTAKNRIVVERWHPDDVPFPEHLELRLDPEATGRAREAEWRIRELETEVAALAAALKAAVALVPVAVANDLRRIFRERRDHGLRSIA